MSRRVKVDEDCPQCGAIFSFDEMSQGRCFYCGWPEVIEEDIDDQDDDFDDYYLVGSI